MCRANTCQARHAYRDNQHTAIEIDHSVEESLKVSKIRKKAIGADKTESSGLVQTKLTIISLSNYHGRRGVLSFGRDLITVLEVGKHVLK